jgi:putative Ca2+/H+ antiporter (TMEM165/GDT1 family)
VKLDTAPLSLACTSQSESKPELRDDPDLNSMTAQTVSLEGESFIEVSTTNEQPSTTAADCSQKQSAMTVFLTTFATIFLAEIGDKTQLSILLMSAESHSPWVVFLGAATALITTSLLGVILGRWMAKRLSPKVVEKASGILLLLISLLLFWDLVVG